MKKYFLVLLGILICSMSVTFVDAKTAKTPAVASAIKMYKAKNYSQCYTYLSDVVKKDSSNGLAYYYLAMSAAQIGKRDEAITNYDKAIALSPNGILGQYAAKGKQCLEDSTKCHESVGTTDAEESFIRGSYGSGFSNQARSDYEKQKIENLMREINRNGDVTPQDFKEYKDFSSEIPTNDEIVAAFRTLQKAGLTDFVSGNSVSDMSFLTGGQTNRETAILNMLTGNSNSNSSLSPQVIQSLLTNQMSLGF